jgi:hypothetical protein
MLEIDVTSDVDRVFSEIGDFFRDQIPFATSQALNDTAFDIRRRVVGSTWPKAVTMRNRVFPGLIFYVGQKATKTMLEAVVGDFGRDKFGVGFDYVERLADGGTKFPRGNWLAVPVDAKRNRGGGIAKAYKPRMLKNSFIREMKSGKGKVILQRNKAGENVVKYLLIKRAEIHATFRFEEDSTDTGIRVFPGHWSRRLGDAVSRSKVFT